jgi:ABC-2 type transport system ATP-binding protein
MIHLEHASRWYGQVIGVNDITCQLGGGITALLGPNGAGKSTLLKLITGQLRPTTGRVSVFGEKPFANARVLRRIGYCPEVDSSYDDLSGRQFVTLLAALAGLSGRLLRERVEEAIGRVGMAPNADRRIGGYSMGMRQRIKLAQALVHEPELLILDEPLSGLDPLGRREVTRLLVALAEAGRGIVVSSHILHEVEQLTRNILLMHRNRLLAQGDIYQIRRLIDAHPHRIAVATRQARALAKELLDLPYVLSVRLDGPDEGSLEVETRSPEQFYAHFPDIVRTCGLVIDGFDSPDNNLDAVFSYLVDG